MRNREERKKADKAERDQWEAKKEAEIRVRHRVSPLMSATRTASRCAAQG